MPFGYSLKSFPYPAVEYIPLLPQKSATLEARIKKKPDLMLFRQINSPALKPFLSQEIDFSLDLETELGMIIFNSQLKLIKYRGNYVTIAITPQPGQNQIMTILTKYFYKQHLIFKLIEPSSGNIFSQEKLLLSNIR